MDEAVEHDKGQPDDLGSGPVPDADLATEPGQLGGDDTVEANDQLDGGVQR